MPKNKLQRLPFQVAFSVFYLKSFLWLKKLDTRADRAVGTNMYANIKDERSLNSPSDECLTLVLYIVP